MSSCPRCWTWMLPLLVVQMVRLSSSAPLSNSTTFSPTTSSSSISPVISSTSSPSSSSTPSTSSSTSSSATPPAASTSAASTWPDYEATAPTTTADTEWPPYADEIRRWPGYWIKTDGEQEEAQESVIDYRTEIYHIADLFAPRNHPN